MANSRKTFSNIYLVVFVAALDPPEPDPLEHVFDLVLGIPAQLGVLLALLHVPDESPEKQYRRILNIRNRENGRVTFSVTFYPC